MSRGGRNAATRRLIASALGDAYRRVSSEPAAAWLLPFALGVGAGGAVAWWSLENGLLSPRPAARGGADEPHTPALDHPAAVHGLPTGSETLRPFRGFVSCWDARTRNPRWVVERLAKLEGGRRSSGSASRALSSFSEDAGVEPRFRARLEDYRGSGLDRGHLAPAASHKGSQAELDETFVLSNISPQVGAGFNRDYWARLEAWVGELRGSHELLVATGPLWLPTPAPDGGWRLQHGFLGAAPRLVSVPTHFFKIVLACHPDGSPAALQAFVLPNAPIPPGLPLRAFAAPLHALEEAAGLRFFERALPAVERAAFADREAAWLAAQAPALGGGQARALLPPAAGKEGAAAPPPRAKREGGRIRPLCDVVACALPAENFWTASKAAGEAAPLELPSGSAAGPPDADSKE